MSQLDLATFLPYLLSITSNGVSDLIAGEYQNRFGLKIPEWRMMAILGEGTPMTQRDLVRATLMDKVTISRATAALADRHLLTRTPSTSDGRSHLLELSEAGVSLYHEIAPHALAMEGQIMSVLSEEERATLAAMLARIRESTTRVAAEGQRR